MKTTARMTSIMVAASVIGALGATASAALAGGLTTAEPTPAVAAPSLDTGLAPVPYLRLEIGRGRTSFGDAAWQPPGYPVDPEITFDLDDVDTNFGAIAVGYDWMNGFRGDIALLGTSKAALAGPGVSTTPGPHAAISGGDLRTTALMGSLYYAPLEQRGVQSRVQPFVVGGIGFARNTVSEWTRYDAGGSRPSRSFEGDSQSGLAFSLGFGVSVQLTPAGRHPVMLEAAYRYYNFGEAKGGTEPLRGNGSSTPVEALNFTAEDQVISVGLRIPLKTR